MIHGKLKEDKMIKHHLKVKTSETRTEKGSIVRKIIPQEISTKEEMREDIEIGNPLHIKKVEEMSIEEEITMIGGIKIDNIMIIIEEKIESKNLVINSHISPEQGEVREDRPFNQRWH